jgi:endonuclease/exonuclease/phosphatase family metal-dependent hydrolase
VPFRPEAAAAAIALGADVLVFTEFFPKQHEDRFRATLANAGWSEQRMSAQPSENANRVLIASKLQLSPLNLDLPKSDQQFPANLLAVSLPSVGFSLLGVRIPDYKTAHLLLSAWEWLEVTATSLKNSPSVIIGDLNVEVSKNSRAGKCFRSILADGWHRAEPGKATFFGHKGRTSEIDHVLATRDCTLSEADTFTGAPISDHAALMCRVERRV